MLTVLLILAVVCCAIAAWLHAKGIVYLGRTAAGWTSVHDDRHTLGERIRVLEVAGTYQSATYLDERWADPVFPYHRLFDHLFDRWPRADGPRSVAVLGGGGYAIPKHLVAHHSQIARIDVVELDVAIERLAHRFFFLDRLEREYGAQSNGRLHLYVDEARAWLEGCDEHFDVIINDCFFGIDPERGLMTADAAHLIHDHLTPEGLYLTNIVSALEGPASQTMYAVIMALKCAFEHVWVYPCNAEHPQSPDNNVVIATDASCSFPEAWLWPPDAEELP